jgi:hypothetical protein
MFKKRKFTLNMPLSYLKKKREKGDDMFGRPDYIANGKMIGGLLALGTTKLQKFFTNQMAIPLPDLDGLCEFVSDPEYNNVLDGPLEDYYKQTGKVPRTNVPIIDLALAYLGMIWTFTRLKNQNQNQNQAKYFHQPEMQKMANRQYQPISTPQMFPPPPRYMNRSQQPMPQPPPVHQQFYNPPPTANGPVPPPIYHSYTPENRQNQNIVMSRTLQKRVVHQPDPLDNEDLHMIRELRKDMENDDQVINTNWSDRIPENIFDNESTNTTNYSESDEEENTTQDEYDIQIN